jgi:hypothetical protein
MAWTGLVPKRPRSCGAQASISRRVHSYALLARALSTSVPSCCDWPGDTMNSMLALHFAYHVLGASVLTALFARFLLAWPREAERYPAQVRRKLFVPFSTEWQGEVDPDHLPVLHKFRKRAKWAAIAALSFAYAECGYYLASM